MTSFMLLTSSAGSDIGEGGQITLPELGVIQMWEKITTGASSFITGVVTPTFQMCSENEICLAFLTVTFVGLGVRIVRRIVGAFGRGR